MGFPSPVFRTVDKLTLRSVPQPDFRTTVFAPFIGTEIHPLTIAFFKIKAHIHMNETNLNSQKAKHSERRVGLRSEEHPMTLP